MAGLLYDLILETAVCKKTFWQTYLTQIISVRL